VKPLQRRTGRVPPAQVINQPTRQSAEQPLRIAKSVSRTTPPPLTGLDRRTEQRMTRGKVEIDSRIDLHGTSVSEARERLRSFLDRVRREGGRTVLVITGKGASPFAGHTLHGREFFHAPERQGRLRRSVPEWLHEPEFRALVAGFQPAHPKHGGGGAFYVRLRRPYSKNEA
jgi:DNA-nicking Smr family endonuclease